MIANVPSSSSGDHGQPFAKVFKQYEYDFYKVDPLLFSPAVVTIHNLRSGRTWTSGRVEPEILTPVVSFMSGTRILCLGAGEGWHASQLREAGAPTSAVAFRMATYESLRVSVTEQGTQVSNARRDRSSDFDVVLTRTMPAGSLEQITFRLATLHALSSAGFAVRHRFAGGRPCCRSSTHRGDLEIAIDKFATLARVASLGYPVPETIVVAVTR